jgi:hypothetical protein
MANKRIVSGQDLIPKKISSFKTESFVSKTSVWTERDNDYRVYYLQHALTQVREKKNPREAVLEYDGSSGQGKNVPPQEMLEDMRNTTKDILIEVLWWGKTKDAAPIEQEYIYEYDWPVGGIEAWKPRIQRKDKCYNKHATGKGTVPKEKMLSEIAYKKLSIKVQKHWDWLKDPEQLGDDKNLINFKQYDKGFLSHAEIEELRQLEKFIQSRMKLFGNPTEVEKKKESFLKDIDHNKWPPIWVLMPKPGSGDLCIILDGNERSIAKCSVRKILGLNTVQIPYSEWNGISKTELEVIGHSLNTPPFDLPDYTNRDQDTFRAVRNLLVQYDLNGSKDGLDDPRIINTLIDKFKYTFDESEKIINALKKEYEDTEKKETKRQESNYDFSHDALKQDYHDKKKTQPVFNPNLEQYHKHVNNFIKEYKEREENPITFIDKPDVSDPSSLKDYNILRISSGVWGPSKITEEMVRYKKQIIKGERTSIPKNMLVLVAFELQDEFNVWDDTDVKKEIIEFVIDTACAGNKIKVIVRKLPMTKIVEKVEKTPAPQKMLKEVGRVIPHIQTPISKPLTSSPNMV